MKFKINATCSKTNARRGKISLTRGDIETPVFMPVGTRASVKTLTSENLNDIDAKIILGNTYHLMLRPGTDILKKFGGLHDFMNWQRPILTDSGGFQVFSLKSLRKINDQGVWFSSHIDGSKWFMGPKECMDIQAAIGSDIRMVLDECPPWPCDNREMERALKRSTLWAKQCKEHKPDDDSTLFGIVQGGVSREYRLQHASEIADIGFEGYAIGGVSVGEPPHLMYEVGELMGKTLPVDKPRYMMGVGTPEDLLVQVANGIDMFDCVMPTRNGRNGMAFTSEGRVKMRNLQYAYDDTPLDPECECFVCRNYSKAYIRHLITVKEVAGIHFLSYHNIWFYVHLMEKIREAISSGTFFELKENLLRKWTKKDS